MPQRRDLKLHWAACGLTVAMAAVTFMPGQMASAGSVEADRPSAVVWHDPGDIATLDLVNGAGGKEHAPDPMATFTFVKEDMNGTSPKFDIKDDQGVEWKVKMGAEPRSETAATRLMWAAGYFVDEDYYVADLKVDGLPKLHRGKEFVSGGMVHGVRLERRIKEVKNLGTWSWFDNGCGPEQPMNGLMVMMALLNNWDLKDVNNSIYEVEGERRCVVSDVGATFGNTGNTFTRSKSVAKAYADSKFIAKVDSKTVDFVMHSRPFPLAAVDLPNYVTRTKMESVTRHIPRDDARWLGQMLGQLSAQQLNDCFRAAGYSPEEVELYVATVQHRIADLKKL